jgi:galactose mutarotase-like enzyme
MIRLPFLGRARPAFPEPREFGYVELRGGTSRLVLVPSLGGRIVELELAGRQWLWTSDVIPWGPGVDGASYVETADSGGFDECFPTVGACRIPGWVRGFGNIELPDHGELWAQTPAIDVRTSADGQIAACTWRGTRLPYVFTRMARLDGQGRVHLEYRVENLSAERMPFLWSSHPMFPLTPETRLVLHDGARLRLFARHGIDLGEPRSEHRWPVIRGSGKVHDFVAPWDVARRYACKLFLDMPDGLATLREGDRELRFRFRPSEVTHVGLWINKRGWTPFRDEEPYCNLALEPCIGAPDTVSEALGDWRSPAWVEAGGVRRWSLSIEGSTVAISEPTVAAPSQDDA